MAHTRIILAALVAFMIVGVDRAQGYAAGAIKVTHVWTREVPAASKVVGGYMTITNTGAEADTLLGGSVVDVGGFEVHQMEIVGGEMKMRELKPGLKIKPGETIVLKPGSSHTMFLDLKALRKVGRPMKGTLIFEKAGKIDIEYRVEPLGARGSLDGVRPANKATDHEQD